jgi:hypothetical protein
MPLSNILELHRSGSFYKEGTSKYPEANNNISEDVTYDFTKYNLSQVTVIINIKYQLLHPPFTIVV